MRGRGGALLFTCLRRVAELYQADDALFSRYAEQGACRGIVDQSVGAPERGEAERVRGQHQRLDRGGSSSVVGFWVSNDGKLRSIPHSLRFLSTNTSGAASLAFSPNGQFLLVTERETNSIDVFRVHENGTLSPFVNNPSAGPGVFAVAFAPNGAALAVETGPTGGQNASAISSYSVNSDGTLTTISASVPTLGAATCWNAVTPNGKWVYTSNAGTSNVSGFTVGANASLTALAGTIVGTNPAGATNLDIAITADGQFLYTLDAEVGMISIFGIQSDGTLTNLGTVDGLPPNVGFNGISAN